MLFEIEYFSIEIIYLNYATFLKLRIKASNYLTIILIKDRFYVDFIIP